MIVTEEKISRVPLCPVHFTRMRSSEVTWAVLFLFEVETNPSFCCIEIGCPYTYSLSSGYFRFRVGKRIESETALRHLCRVHHRPLYISECDGGSKITAWRCPEARCKTTEKRRMG
jgi:hypothetical protein